MLGFKVTIVRYISDDPQPGIVECHLKDAHGRLWSFVEKIAIVSTEHLDAQTTYPTDGVVAGEIVWRGLDAAGREVIRLSTEQPWHVDSVEGVTQLSAHLGVCTSRHHIHMYPWPCLTLLFSRL
jgi:hypothetical protein